MDKKLNEVTKVTDMAYVPVIMADGSVGQIAKSDLASVVAGVINPLKCGLVVNNSEIRNNLNNLTTPGVYNFVDIENSVANNPGLDYGMVIVLSAGYDYIMQIAFNSNNKNWVRFINSVQSQYNSWQSIDNFGYNSLEELASGVAENNPKTINAMRGKCLYKIGSCGVWLYGGFLASIGDGSGLGSSVVSISYRLMGTAGNVTYSRTGTSTLGISIYKKIENGVLNVYLYSTIGHDSFNPICGLSSSNIELLGEVTDLSSYELVASL